MDMYMLGISKSHNKSPACIDVREDVKIHRRLLQQKCCSIQQQCIAFLTYVGCSWLLNMGAAANEF